MTDEKPMLHVIISPKDEEGVIVGDCLELPLVVEGKTEDEIVQKMHNIAEGFFEIFPERKQEVFNKVITIPATF